MDITQIKINTFFNVSRISLLGELSFYAQTPRRKKTSPKKLNFSTELSKEEQNETTVLCHTVK